MSEQNNKTSTSPVTIQDLADMRKVWGISQAAVAKYFGVSKSTIGFFETGRRLPPDNFLKAYYDYLTAVHFGCTPPENHGVIFKVQDDPSPVIYVSAEEAARTRECRRKVNVSAKQAAALLNITDKALYFKEKGEVKMTRAEYETLMKFYADERVRIQKSLEQSNVQPKKDIRCPVCNSRRMQYTPPDPLNKLRHGYIKCHYCGNIANGDTLTQAYETLRRIAPLAMLVRDLRTIHRKRDKAVVDLELFIDGLEAYMEYINKMEVFEFGLDESESENSDDTPESMAFAEN